MRLINADEIVKVAEHAYHEWNLGMAAAEGNRQINKCYKMQELCKAVKAVAEEAPTIEAEPVVHAHWEENSPGFHRCSRCHWETGEDNIDWGTMEFIPPNYCEHCGAKMDEED